LAETATLPGHRHPLPVLRRYHVNPDTGCWHWLGYVGADGYPRCKPAGENRTSVAHRVFYEHHVGPIPAGLHLDHLCRVRACVNPKHMEPVTHAENNRRGAATKLTASEAREIRAAVDALCERYDVRPRTLSAIGERQIWKDV
jgi:hypothetical protein